MSTDDIVLSLGDYQVNLAIHEKGEISHKQNATGMHSHPHFEIHIVVKGSSILYCSKENVRIGPGNITIIPPRLYHVISEAKDLHRIDFSFSINRVGSSSSVKSINKLLTTFSTLPSDKPTILIDDFSFCDTLMKITHELRLNIAGSYEHASALFCCLFISLLRKLDSLPFKTNGRYQNSVSEQNPYYRRADIIDSFFGEASRYEYRHANIKALSDALHLSVSQTSRTIRFLYNQNFTELLQQSRMEMAMHLLKTTTLKNGDIAKKLGYGSESKFYKAFSSYSGLTPKQYKRNFIQEKSFSGVKKG